MQWGTVKGKSNKDTYDIDLIAFNNTNYSATAIVNRNNVSNEYCVIKEERTASRFTVITWATGRSFSWFAIGF